MRSLPVFVLTRLLSIAAVVVAVAAITFLTLRLLRPESFPAEPGVLAQLVEHLERVFLHYDLGRSQDREGRPVTELLNEGVPADVALLAGGLVIGGLAGMAGGAVCAARPGSIGARVLEALAAFFIIAPVYWVGLMLILAFGDGFGTLIEIPYFRTNVYEHVWDDPAAWVQALLVPWLVLAAPLAALTLRMTRAAMVDVRNEDYLRTAVAKGLPERTVLRRHALPVASSPIMTLVGVNMATLVVNVALVERAFSVPGVFRFSAEAMNDGNFPLLQGMTIAAAVMVVSANLAVDVLQAAVDPRVRQGGSARRA